MAVGCFQERTIRRAHSARCGMKSVGQMQCFDRHSDVETRRTTLQQNFGAARTNPASIPGIRIKSLDNGSPSTSTISAPRLIAKRLNEVEIAVNKTDASTLLPNL